MRDENLRNEKDMLVEVNPLSFWGGARGEASRAESPSVLQEFFERYFVLLGQVCYHVL